MGTRPEIIKMAPVAYALVQAGVRVRIAHTGQHEDMAWPLYEFFGLKVDHSLSLDRQQGSLAQIGAQLLQGLDGLLASTPPDIVLVHGDTLSAHMAALAAFMRRIPVGHVEAGLRSGQSDDPFPEEINRQCVARLASLHFAPTEQARQNLLREGVAPETIHVTGNTIVDAVHLGVQRLQTHAARLCPQLLEFLARQGQRQRILVTAHRRENWGQGIRNIAQAVAQLLHTQPDLCVVWPMHANPAVQQDVRIGLGNLSADCAARLHLCGPLDYPDLLHTLQDCRLVMTDSGGIQEEAVTLQVPVLVLRETTERPEVIESGWGWLVGTAREAILRATTSLLMAPPQDASSAVAHNPFGNGLAALRITAALQPIHKQHGHRRNPSNSTFTEHHTGALP
jgi:UDP-N-acetylglucosamine 2-epimerase